MEEMTHIKKKRYETIVEEATKLYRQGLFSELKFVSIAKKVGITARTLYNYFPCKEALETAILNYSIEHNIKKIREQMKKEVLSYDVKINLIVDQVIDELLKKPPASSSTTSQGEDFEVDSRIKKVTQVLLKEGKKLHYIREDAPIENVIDIILAIIKNIYYEKHHFLYDQQSKLYIKRSIMMVVSSILTEEGAKTELHYSSVQ